MKDPFILLTAVTDGKEIAVRKSAVRMVEDAQIDNKEASHVTLVDGTHFNVDDSVVSILKKLETP